MRIFDWKNSRWAIIIISLVTAALLLGILDSFFGITPTEEFFGFKAQTLAGIAQILVFWIAWKVL